MNQSNLQVSVQSAGDTTFGM